MKITVLVENTTNNKALKPKHGLSFYIETHQHKILFDVGSNDAFIHNARTLGINLAAVDTVVISHGHSDHGGALSGFLKTNDKAKIYLHRKAFEPHYIKVLFAKIYIGLERKLSDNQRFILTDGTMQIDDELFLFSDVDKNFDTKSNRVLLKKTHQGYVQDDFAHEQNLIVTDQGKSALFTGCSHRGIANILCSAKNHNPDIHALLGGFHLYNPANKTAEPPPVVQRLADELSKHDAVFYTGHCTGEKAFNSMRGSMGEKLKRLTTGEVIIL